MTDAAVPLARRRRSSAGSSRRTKFYEHGTVSRRRHASGSSPRSSASPGPTSSPTTTINLPGSDDVPEIQVFEIDAKGDDVATTRARRDRQGRPSPDHLRDRRERRARPSTRWPRPTSSSAPERRSSAPTSAPSWQPADATAMPLPPRSTCTASTPRSWAAAARRRRGRARRCRRPLDRLSRVRKLEREIAALERKLRTEPQLNRKVELRRQTASERTAALAELTDPAPSNKD